LKKNEKYSLVEKIPKYSPEAFDLKYSRANIVGKNMKSNFFFYFSGKKDNLIVHHRQNV
jgi:hypothetical protein